MIAQVLKLRCPALVLIPSASTSSLCVSFPCFLCFYHHPTRAPWRPVLHLRELFVNFYVRPRAPKTTLISRTQKESACWQVWGELKILMKNVLETCTLCEIKFTGSRNGTRNKAELGRQAQAE